MLTKTWTVSLFGVVALACLAPAAQAAEDEEGAWGPITAGATVTSDYRFRGQSQTDRDGAIQGWVQYDHPSGFFANIWASNVDFNDTATYDSSIEVDLTAGYNHAFTDETSAGLKAIYYWYPDADAPPGFGDYDYFELMATASHDFGKAAVSAELAWSPDYFAETGDAVSLKGGVSVPIMDQFAFMGALSASGNIGYQWIDRNISTPPGLPFFYGTPDYLYYDLGASAAWEIFVIDVRWVGTDISKARCYGGTDLCEDGVVVSLTANLPG